MEKNKFTHGSLFSGIGGPEIAAEEMGWKNQCPHRRFSLPAFFLRRTAKGSGR